MGIIKEPPPVKLVCGFIANGEELLSRAKNMLEKEYGKIDLASEIWPFDFTDYYEPEMGDKLIRQLVSFEKLIDPVEISDIKIHANAIEDMLAEESGTMPNRVVNIDPGYVMPSKLVLASTKNFAHRIYLKDGIFAEITLYWRKGRFNAHDWTFPDYRTEKYGNFFTKVRERLMQGAIH